MAVRKKAAKKQVTKKKAVAKKRPAPKSRKFSKQEVTAITKFMRMSDEELREHMPEPGGDHDWNNPLTEDEQEARLAMVYRLTLRGLSIQQIADQLGLSYWYTAKLRSQVKDRNLRMMSKMSVDSYVADTLAFYQELVTSSMLLSTSAKAGVSARNQALINAASIKRQELEFLNRLGLFDHATAAQAARSHFAPFRQREDVVNHDQLALDTLNTINEAMRGKQHLIDVTPEQVFDDE